MQELMEVGDFFVLTPHTLLCHNICIPHVQLDSCYVESHRLTCSCAMFQGQTFSRCNVMVEAWDPNGEIPTLCINIG
jgi:hypothetical protein